MAALLHNPDLRIERIGGHDRLVVTPLDKHGQYGEMRKPYREGQEEQLGALGLVVNALVLWNTLYMQKVLDYLKKQGVTVRDEDVARLSPHRDSSFNFLGQYSFQLPPNVAKGQLRQLRDPDSIDL